jgi:hypothetical protein
MPKHILVVDDSDTCRKVTRLFLVSQLGQSVARSAESISLSWAC